MKDPFAPIHPGEILKQDYMDYYEWDIATLAAKLAIECGIVDDLVNERISVSPELSAKLGKLFETDESYWLRLQKGYELQFIEDKIKLAMQDAGNPLTLDELNKQKIVLATFSAGEGTMNTGVEYDSTHAQKILFMVDREVDQSIGTPFFDFEPYKYGPNDHTINSILNRLADEKFIEIKYPSESMEWKDRRYALKQEGQEIGTEILKRMPNSAQVQITNIVQWALQLDWRKLVNEVFKKYPEMKLSKAAV